MEAENTDKQAENQPTEQSGEPGSGSIQIEVLEEVHHPPAAPPAPEAKPDAKPAAEPAKEEAPAKDESEAKKDDDYELIEEPQGEKAPEPEKKPAEEQRRPALPKEVSTRLEQANVFERHINEFLDDPTNRRQYLQWRKAHGFHMEPDWEKELAAPPQKPEQELKSEEEIIGEARKLQDAGKDIEAQKLISSYYSEKNRREIAEVKAKLAQNDEQAKRNEEERVRREVDAAEDRAWGALVERFPKLFQAASGGPLRVKCDDGPFWRAFLENVQANPNGDLVAMARGTLIQMGRVRPKRAKTVMPDVPKGGGALTAPVKREKGTQQIEVLEPSDGIFRV